MSHKTVRIIKNWDFPNWLQMSPGSEGIWDGIKFTEEAIENPDYVIVLNQPNDPTCLNIAENKVWAIIQEPPTKFHRYLHKGQSGYSRIYTSDTTLTGQDCRYIANYPVLAWHVLKSFDELINLEPIPKKTKDLSWITSTLSFLPGHKERMDLVEKVKTENCADLFGRGLNFVEDKWDALAPYRYSIVFENHINSHYWSEKLIDCFLSGTVPIYVGCTEISKYFPKNSFINFEPKTPDPIRELNKILNSSFAEDNKDSLIEARRRCLYEHQLFPFLANEISSNNDPLLERTEIELKPRRLTHPIYLSRAIWHWKVKPILKRFRKK